MAERAPTSLSEREYGVGATVVVKRRGSDFARYADVIDAEDFGVGLMFKVRFTGGRTHWYFDDELRLAS